MMKRFFIIIFATLLCATGMTAQKHHHFDPAQFQADLEQFITSEAGLTPKESAAFFPVYREMREKQLAFSGRTDACAMWTPTTTRHVQRP